MTCSHNRRKLSKNFGVNNLTLSFFNWALNNRIKKRLRINSINKTNINVIKIKKGLILFNIFLNS